MATLSSHKVAIAALLTICALAAAAKLTYAGLTPNADYGGYIATAELLSGHPAEAVPSRLLKPLAPLAVAAIAPLTGFPSAFLLEVIFFYFLFALALYALAYIFFEDQRLAFIAALLGVLSYPILRYALDLYTETGAQFFYLLSLALTLLYIKAPSRKLLVLNGLALGIGLLWKEYSVVAGLIYGLALLCERAPWQAKLKNLALLALISLTPSVLVQIWVYLGYHYTYLTWYTVGGASGFAAQFTYFNLIKSTAALVGLGWLLVPLGIWRWPSLSSAQSRFLACAIPPSLLAFAWGNVSSRLFYVMAPAAILLGVWGMARWPRWAQSVVLVVILLLNLAWLAISVR